MNTLSLDGKPEIAVIFYDPTEKTAPKIVALLKSFDLYEKVLWQFKREAKNSGLLVCGLLSYFNHFEKDDWKPSLSFSDAMVDPFHKAFTELKKWVDGVSTFEDYMYGHASAVTDLKLENEKFIAVFMDAVLHAAINFSEIAKEENGLIVNTTYFPLSFLAGVWSMEHPNFHP